MTPILCQLPRIGAVLDGYARTFNPFCTRRVRKVRDLRDFLVGQRSVSDILGRHVKVID